MDSKIIPSKSHYNVSYLGNNFERFYSYRLQLYYALKSKQNKILIIGKGDGLIGDLLINNSLDVISLDINSDLLPDVVGDVICLPFNDFIFGCSICCQVLEHLPYDLFLNSLIELRRVTSGFLVLSLPDKRRFLSLRIKFFNKFMLNYQYSMSKIFPENGPPNSNEHFWEIGYKGYDISNIKNNILKAGWQILEIQRIHDFPYHTFFYLK